MFSIDPPLPDEPCEWHDFQDAHDCSECEALQSHAEDMEFESHRDNMIEAGLL